MRPSPKLHIPCPTTRGCRGRLLLVLVCAGMAVAPLGAQYTVLDRQGSGALFGTDHQLVDSETLRQQVDLAPWRLGVFRFSPELGIRDARVVSEAASGEDAENTGTDLTATAAAGLRAYVRNGPKVIWALHAVPEYVWWQDDTERRRWNGRYGAGLFVDFNRLDLELSGRREDSQDLFSPEVERFSSSRIDRSKVGAELDLGRGVTVFVSALRRDISSRDRSTDLFASLDRESTELRGGVRFRLPQGFLLGLGYEDSETDFEPGARNLSTEGSAQLVELAYEGNRFAAGLDLQFRDLDPAANSEFPASSETTGRLSTRIRMGERVLFGVYGARELSFSVSANNASFSSERFGVEWLYRQQRGSRGLALRLLAETGEDSFTAAAGSGVQDRTEDVVTVGGTLSLAVRRNLRVEVSGFRSDYDTAPGQPDRDVDALGVNLAFDLRPFLEKLGLASREGREVW